MTFRTKKILAPAIIFLLFLLFYNLRVFRPIEPFVDKIASRAQIAALKVAGYASSRLKSQTVSKQKLMNIIVDQETKINELTVVLIRLKQIKKENNELRALLEFKEQNNFSIMPAKIIYKSIFEREKKIILNKGAEDGARIGSAVIINNGIFIGKIISADPKTSVVQLTIDSNSAILGTLDGISDTIAGVMKGSRGTSLRFTLIPKTVSLHPGEWVITSGLQDSIPAALYIGEIISLEESENSIFNTALVKPPYIIENLSVAAIILK